MILNNDEISIGKSNFLEKKFHYYFSDVLVTINHSFNAYFKAYFLKYMSYPKYLVKCDEAISKYIKEWTTMTNFNDHRIAMHVYKMLFSLQNDPDYKLLDDYDKNILLWTCLLHDIAKRGAPICNHRDHTHPFRGAGIVLHILKGFGFFDCSKELMDVWDKIFEKAIRKNYLGQEEHDNSKLEEIFKILCKIFPETTMEKEIIILILLHQSLPTLPEFQYHIVLNPLYEEVSKYFTKRLLLLMKLVIKHDSLSYFIGGKIWKAHSASKIFDQIIDNILINTKFKE